MPPLQAKSMGRHVCSKYPSGFDGARANHFVRGRYALFHALQRLEVGRQRGVMVPAYHCRTMIDPIIRAGAHALFYPLQADLSPDLQQLDEQVAAAAVPVKALLLPHYFGYPQHIEPVLDFCRQRGIALIEDCAHAYFGTWRGRTLGTWGDCAIASPSKFFACEDGGTLITAGAERAISPRRRPFVDELRGVYHSLEKAWADRKRRPGEASAGELRQRFESVRQRSPRWSESTESSAEASLSHQYLPALETSRALAWSRCVIRLGNVEQLCESRRDNFAALLEGVKQLPGCRPLFPSLPPGVVPYMFPLLIEQPELRFDWLKQLGVPMYRWDELALAGCPVSEHYRLHLVHLPCHQGLRRADIEWLLSAVKLVMEARPSPQVAA